MMLLDHSQSCLLPIDLQARLLPAIADPQRIIANNAILLKSAGRLAVPVLASEQYPRGLGPIVPDLAALLPENAVIEKLAFSCLRDPAYQQRFIALGRRQVVVTGAETHVCVLQTVLVLRDWGQEVYVVADACGSRTPDNHRAGLARMQAAGATLVTTEMVVFEWLERAGTPEFKELSALVK